jgi:translation elongation factor EF-Tu-like GTPase
MSEERSVGIVKVAQIVPMEDPASLLVVGTIESGGVDRGSIAKLGDEAMATVSGMREVTNEKGTFVGVLMRCRTVDDAQQWLSAPLEGKSVVFQSAF